MSSCVIINDFLNYLKHEKYYSENTRNCYATDLRQFADFVISNSDIAVSGQSNCIQQYGDISGGLLVPIKSCTEELLLTVDSDLIRRYLLFLDLKQYSKATALRKLVCLRGFYKFLKRQRCLYLNPTDSVKSPKQIKKLPKILEYEDIQRLLQTPPTNNWLGVRDRAILETLYSTGMRTSELVALNIRDIDFLNEMVYIRTSSKKERILPLSPSALQAIQFYLEFRNKRERALRATKKYMKLRNKKIRNNCTFDSKILFINKDGICLSERSVRRKMDKYLKIAGLDQSISPRTLRHSFAAHILENGTELQKLQGLLGHQALSTTRAYSYLITESHNDLSKDGLEKCIKEDEKRLVNAC